MQCQCPIGSSWPAAHSLLTSELLPCKPTSYLPCRYAATATLVSLGSEAALRAIDRPAVWTFLHRMCVPGGRGGGMAVHAGGEVDIRSCYLAVATAHMLGLDAHALAAECDMVDYIRRCQSYEVRAASHADHQTLDSALHNRERLVAALAALAHAAHACDVYTGCVGGDDTCEACALVFYRLLERTVSDHRFLTCALVIYRLLERTVSDNRFLTCALVVYRMLEQFLITDFPSGPPNSLPWQQEGGLTPVRSISQILRAATRRGYCRNFAIVTHVCMCTVSGYALPSCSCRHMHVLYVKSRLTCMLTLAETVWSPHCACPLHQINNDPPPRIAVTLPPRFLATEVYSKDR